MTTPTRRLRTALAIVFTSALALSAAACGDDGEDASTTTAAEPATETTVASSEFLEVAEERGAPTLEATDPVEELVVTDDVEGTGVEVQPGDAVTAHYVGVSASTGEEFDSSWQRGEPATFPLDGVIEGWSEGLVGMSEGGRRTLVIPAGLAYGDNPPPGSGIEPGETLVFTIDLVAVEPAG